GPASCRAEWPLHHGADDPHQRRRLSAVRVPTPLVVSPLPSAADRPACRWSERQPPLRGSAAFRPRRRAEPPSTLLSQKLLSTTPVNRDERQASGNECRTRTGSTRHPPN